MRRHAPRQGFELEPPHSSLLAQRQNEDAAEGGNRDPYLQPPT